MSNVDVQGAFTSVVDNVAEGLVNNYNYFSEQYNNYDQNQQYDGQNHN